MSESMDVFEKAQKVHSKILRMRPVSMHAGEPGARLLLALRAGEPIVVLKSFASGNGHDLQPGERLANPELFPEGRLAMMAEHRFICSEREWQESQDYNSNYALWSNELEPLLAMLSQARKAAQSAAQEMASLQAQLMAAKQKATKAGDYVRFCEQELSQALELPQAKALIE